MLVTLLSELEIERMYTYFFIAADVSNHFKEKAQTLLCLLCTCFSLREYSIEVCIKISLETNLVDRNTIPHT